MKNYRIGVDVGGTKVAYGLFRNDNDELIYEHSHPSSRELNGEEFSDVIIDNIGEILKAHDLRLEDLSGVGICMPSYILFEEGVICMTTALPRLNNFAMRDYVKGRLDTQIVLENDSNCAALAEHRYGAGRGKKHLVYCSASTGFGSGIIINNELFRGSNGFAGESGHMLITPNEGVMCGCNNNGCFMSYIGGLFYPQHVKILSEKYKTEMDLDNINNYALHDACERGDELATAVIDQAAFYLGVGAFNIYQLLNIDTFVFGGGLVNFGDLLFGRARKVFDGFNHTTQPVEFRFAELKNNFGIVGAAELIK